METPELVVVGTELLLELRELELVDLEVLADVVTEDELLDLIEVVVGATELLEEVVETFEVLVYADSNVVSLLLFFLDSDVHVNDGYPARRESPARRLPCTKRLEAY